MRAAGLAAIAAGLAAGVEAEGPFLHVNTSSVTHGSWVRATFSLGTGKPETDCWVGVYSPANASTATIPAQAYPASPPWTAAFPQKWVTCDSVQWASDGTATYDFILWNAFEDIALNLFSGSITTPKFVAGSGPITFTDTDVPLRGHIARVPSEPTSMLVTWHSAHADADAAVRWGSAPGVYTSSAPAVAASYTKEDLCGLPATGPGWFPSHFWLSANISGLKLGGGATVYYTYGSDSHGWSAEASFVTPPAPGADQTVAMLLLADNGVTEPDNTTDHWDEPRASSVMAHLINKAQTEDAPPYSLTLHPGDVSYATGTLLKWETHMSRLQQLAESVPYMVGHGNHERDWPGTGTNYDDSTDSGGECGVATNTRFPGSIEWYSFQHGPVNVLMLNSEMSVAPGSPQYTYAQSVLQGVDRAVTPWSIVAFHRPMYFVENTPTGGTRDSNFGQLEPLFYQTEVDLVLAGHVHNAYVSCPVINSTCRSASTPGGYAAPVHVCIGNAGQGLTPINATHAPNWATYQASEWGYSTLHVTPSPDGATTTLAVKLYDDATDTLQYTVTLNRTITKRW